MKHLIQQQSRAEHSAIMAPPIQKTAAPPTARRRLGLMKALFAIILFMLGSFAMSAQTVHNLNDNTKGAVSLRSTTAVPQEFLKEAKAARAFAINPALQKANSVKVGDMVNLQLFEGKSYMATVSRVNTDANGCFAITLKFPEYQYGYAIIVSDKDGKSLVTVSIPELGQTFGSMYNTHSNKYYLIEVDESKVKHPYSEGDDMVPYPETSKILKNNTNESTLEEFVPQLRAGENCSPGYQTNVTSNATIKVLVVYTQGAANNASSNGGIGIDAVITRMMAAGNLALTNSNTGITLEYVSRQVNYSESGSTNTSLNNLSTPDDGIMDDIHAWRKDENADLVQLITTDTSSGGLGQTLNINLDQPYNCVFSVVSIQNVGSSNSQYHLSSVHELGHNMGLGHGANMNTNIAVGIFSYSQGWDWISNGQRYCSVMSYPNSTYYADGQDRTRVSYFSNPDVYYEEQKTGHSTNADAARSLRETKHAVAHYSDRINNLDLLTAPTNIVVSNPTDHGATFSWDAVPGATKYQFYAIVKSGGTARWDEIGDTYCTRNAPTNFDPCATYEYWIQVKNECGDYVESQHFTFKTKCPTDPTVTTNTQSSLTHNSVTLRKSVTANGDAITSQGFKYKETTAADWTIVTTNDNNYNLTGLSSNTTYKYYAWATTSSGTFNGNVLTFTTSAPPLTPVTNTASSAEVTYAGNTIDISTLNSLFTLGAGAGVPTFSLETTEEGYTGDGSLSGTLLTVTKAGTFKIGLVTAATSTHAAGTKVIATLTVSPGAQSAPTGLGHTDVTTYGGSDGTITGVTTEMKYKLSSAEGDYTTVTGTKITGLSAGTYHVRYKATDLYSESADAEVTIGVKYGISIAGATNGGTHNFTTEAVPEEYGEQAALTVTVTNEGNQLTGQLTVTISADNAFNLSATTISNIEVGGNADFTVKPKNGLSVGTYTATVTITGTNINTQSFTVSFAVTTATSYTVTFDAQGGSVTPTSLTVTPGLPIGTLPSPGTKEGYRFDGWFTAVNGGGTQYTATTTVNASITLYAKWTAVYELSFNVGANGSASLSNGAPTAYAAGETVTLTVTPDAGYELDALYYMDGSTRIDISGVSFTMPAYAVTVHATFKLTDAKAVELAKDALTWDNIKGSNTAQSDVTTALTLPTTGSNDTNISWSSNNTAVNATTGAVTRPNYPASDASVTLTATIKRGNPEVSDTKVFNLTVTRIPDTTAPTVSSTSPTGSNIAIPTSISVTFDEPMKTDAGTVSLSPATLSNQSWSNENKTVTYSVSGLAYGTTYTFNISGFEDVSGNQMTAVTTGHSFTTIGQEATPNATINYETEKLILANGTYIIGSSEYTVTSGEMDITTWIGQTLSIIKKGNGSSTTDSEAQSLSVPARPGTPSATGTNETVAGQSDGKITGVSSAMEYKLSTASDWTAITGTEITGLAPGTYQVRIKATTSAFASSAVDVPIATGNAQTRTLSVTAPTFASVDFGYTTPPAAQSITITNSGNSAATIASVAIDPATAFDLGTGNTTVAAGATISSWTIQPKAGLAANDYSATITVTYDGTNGTTATATVSFIVSKVKESSPTATIGFINEKLTGLDNATYIIGSTEYTVANGESAIDASWLNTTISIVKKSTGASMLDSDPQSLQIPARPDAPAATGVDETIEGLNDGKITGVSSAMEYKSSSASVWTAITGTEITGLAPGTYQVRIKATTSAFASSIKDVTISAGAQQTRTLVVTAPTFTAENFGYSRPAAQPISIKNEGNSAATISSVTIDPATAFEIAGSGASVAAGATITSWTIQPKAGLAAGDYSATITVTYDNNATATATVSFTVNTVKEGTPTATINYETEKLTGLIATATYIIGSTEYTADASGEISILDSWMTGTGINIVKKSTGTSMLNSDAQSLSIPARPAAPTATGVNTSASGQSDGKITGLVASTAYEYDKDNSGSFTSATSSASGEITGLATGIYQIRLKATASTFASSSVAIEIATGSTQTITLSVTAPTFASVDFGYTTPPAAQSITIANSGNSAATISSVTIDPATAFDLGTGNTSVAAGGSNTSWTIQPKAGLAAGDYSATITVTYDGTNGTTATATVSFTVNPIVNAETPSITGQLPDATYTQGSTATALSVSASVNDGGSLSYQWYSNSTNSTTGGTTVGTNSSHTPSTATVGTTYYYVVITNTNNNVNGTKTATATSNAAKVEVTAPAAIEITGFAAIADFSGGTPSNPTYADAADVISALPANVTANYSGGTVSWPVSSWTDTDSYNTAEGSYTFTAILGAAPAGYANSGNYTATVEVVISSSPASSYSVTIASSSNGSVTLDNATTSYAAAATVSLTISPADGYELDNITTTPSVAVTVSGNTATFTMPAANITVTATFKKTQAQLDSEALEAAKAAIEGGTYNVAMTTANSAATVRTWLVNTLNVWFGQSNDVLFRAGSIDGIVDVAVSNVTPAVAGTASNPNGVNGSFKFTVTLSKGSATITTALKSGTITATTWTVTPSPDPVPTPTPVTDQEWITLQQAISLISSSRIEIPQVNAGTKAEAEAWLTSFVKDLLKANGFGTISINYLSVFTLNEAIAGSSTYTGGTNGSLIFDLILTNKYTQRLNNKTGIIVATVYSANESAASISGISVSPVPAKDFISIKSELPVRKIELYSLSGSLIFSGTLTERIPVSNLPAGVYMLRIHTDSGSEIRKIVKE